MALPSAVCCQTRILPLTQVEQIGKPFAQCNKHLNLSTCLVPPLMAAVLTLSPFCNPPEFLTLFGHMEFKNGSIREHVISNRNLNTERAPRKVKEISPLLELHSANHSPNTRKILGLSASDYFGIAFSHGSNASLGQGVDVHRGAALFNKACIGCHVAGGNIIQPGATLFSDDLVRNGAETEEKIYEITYSGKGRMPGFGQNCTPRGQCTFGARLQDAEIKILAEFVRSQADQGWTSTEISGD